MKASRGSCDGPLGDRLAAFAQEILPMTTDIHPSPAQAHRRERAKTVQVIIYGHSALFYWWPLWVVGYVMALLTWMHHDQAVIGNQAEWFHPSKDLGAIYTMLLLLLIVLTGTKVKGMKAALLIAALAFVALLFVHLNWWDRILSWFGHQSISLSFGYYIFSSSLLLLIWVVNVFVIDRLSFWRFRPGQVTHEYLGGIVNNSYDTTNLTMSLNRQNDFFRHWIIGLGSGDLHMQTMGGRGLEINVVNVLFVGTKMLKIQRLVATKPDVPQQA
jgi:hypothetical protein